LCFLRPTQIHNQYGKSTGSDVSAQHSSRQKVPILYNGRSFPPKLPLIMGDLHPIKFMILGPMRAHSPNSKWYHDRFSCFRTSDHRVSYGLQWAIMGRSFLPHCPFPWGDLDPNLIRGSLGPAGSSDLNPNDISIGSAVLHLYARVVWAMQLNLILRNHF